MTIHTQRQMYCHFYLYKKKKVSYQPSLNTFLCMVETWIKDHVYISLSSALFHEKDIKSREGVGIHTRGATHTRCHPHLRRVLRATPLWVAGELRSSFLPLDQHRFQDGSGGFIPFSLSLSLHMVCVYIYRAHGIYPPHSLSALRATLVDPPPPFFTLSLSPSHPLRARSSRFEQRERLQAERLARRSIRADIRIALL